MLRYTALAWGEASRGRTSAVTPTWKFMADRLPRKLHLAGIDVEHKVVCGAAPKAIYSVAQEIGSDLIVMTTHGRSGAERFFVSDVTGEVIRQSEIPILLIRPTEEWRSRRTQFMRLLLSLDGSSAAEQVLRYARALAQTFGSEILLLGVPEADSEESLLREYVEKVADALRARNLRARAVVTGSGPARTLVAVSEAEQVDLC